MVVEGEIILEKLQFEKENDSFKFFKYRRKNKPPLIIIDDIEKKVYLFFSTNFENEVIYMQKPFDYFLGDKNDWTGTNTIS